MSTMFASFRLYLYMQHYAFTDPPNGEEPCVKVQRHLELEARKNPLICDEKQDSLARTDWVYKRNINDNHCKPAFILTAHPGYPLCC